MLLGFALFARKERCGQDSEGAPTEQYPHGQQRKDRNNQSPVASRLSTRDGHRIEGGLHRKSDGCFWVALVAHMHVKSLASALRKPCPPAGSVSTSQNLIVWGGGSARKERAGDEESQDKEIRPRSSLLCLFSKSASAP